jgi:hypothetical protein
MNYGDYRYCYRYVCNSCTLGIEVKTWYAIPKDPTCPVCSENVKMMSYYGPNGEAMYKKY